MPMPSRANDAGSGTPVDEKPWLMMEIPAPAEPPTSRISFETSIDCTPGNMTEALLPPLLEISIDLLVPLGKSNNSLTDPEPVPPKVLKAPDRLASVRK